MSLPAGRVARRLKEGSGVFAGDSVTRRLDRLAASLSGGRGGALVDVA